MKFTTKERVYQGILEALTEENRMPTIKELMYSAKVNRGGVLRALVKLETENRIRKLPNGTIRFAAR